MCVLVRFNGLVLLMDICGSGRFGRGRAQLQSHPHDFTLLSDRLPEFLADSNDATTHASWLGVVLLFNSMMLFGY